MAWSLFGGVWRRDLYVADEVFFANVLEAVWKYELGGYPVLKKWLGYRQADRRDGQPLTADERRWFKSIVQRVAALLTLSARLDELYSLASENAYTAADPRGFRDFLDCPRFPGSPDCRYCRNSPDAYQPPCPYPARRCRRRSTCGHASR
jgi:hypothetical protein